MRKARKTPVSRKQALAIMAGVLKTKKVNNLQQRVIDSIKNELPKSFFDATTLSHWFGNVAFLIVRILDKDDKDTFDLVSLIYKEIRYNMQKDVFQAIQKIIEKEKPDRVNPAYIIKVAKELPVKLFYVGYKNADKKVDWDFIISKLGLTDKFVHKDNPELRFNKVIEKIIEALELENPEYFDTVWIDGVSSDDYKFIKYNYSWEVLKERLPKKWQERFIYIPNNKYTLSDIRDKLVAILENENPNFFRPEWIRKKDFNMWLVLRNRLIGRYGDSKYPDWDIIVRTLPEKWQKRWKYRGVIASVQMPDFNHSNYDEVQSLHNEYSESLVFFYFQKGRYLTRKEKDQMEDVIMALRSLAEKGNSVANDAMITHVLALADIWSREREDFKIWEYHPKRLEELVKKCLYNYKPGKFEGKKLFVNYVETSMKRAGMSLQERFVSFEKIERTTKQS